MKIPAASIERLEARIAPAALNPAGNVLTYTDVDGDFVKITFTGGAVVNQGNFSFFSGFLPGDTTTPQILNILTLTGKTGAGFTLTATPKPGQGDSHANIFTIDADGTDLGKINVDGDVGEITAGTGDPGTVGLKSFTAFSMGQNLATNSYLSILKNVGAFTVKTDVSNEELRFTGGVKSLSIGGDLRELRDAPAKLNITGDVGSLKIGGSVIGRASTEGNIIVDGALGTLSIGGSIIGGDEPVFSFRQVYVGPVKTFSVGGDLVGGLGQYSGSVSLASVGTARIGGSIIGADNARFSGIFTVGGDATSVTIGGSVLGGNATSGAVFFNGLMEFGGKVGNLKLGHDLIGGREDGGTLTESGMITVVGTIGTMTVGGSITGDSTHAAYISVGGGGTTTALAAIKTLNVKGSLVHARLLAGYDFGSAQKNLDSGFGSITIGGSLAASTITAGSSKGTDGIPGTSDDTAVSTVATIGSVKIGGAFRGVAGSSTLFYLYAPIVNKLTVAKASYNHAQLMAVVHFDSIGKATALSVL